MNIHEYQAKQLLKDYGVPVSDGRVVLKADEAKTAAGELDGPIWVVKAQIHAGGRGKGKFKEAPPAPRAASASPSRSPRPRTRRRRCSAAPWSPTRPGPAGKVVNRVYIEDGSESPASSICAAHRPRLVARSPSSARPRAAWTSRRSRPTPEKILSFTVDPASGISGFHGRRSPSRSGLRGTPVKQCVDLIARLYRLFVEKDARCSRSTR